MYEMRSKDNAGDVAASKAIGWDKSAFTLIEFLVCVAVAAILATLVIQYEIDLKHRANAKRYSTNVTENVTKVIPKRFTLEFATAPHDIQTLYLITDTKTGREYLAYYNGGIVPLGTTNKVNVEAK
jgi:prepilin-type N-terminal cleavage/methylation domain-containing protein